ncbi:glycoside hydrolase family 88 protein [Niabella soli]|uniref:Glucuronyl hydrolase n=1 Tax=Niabella soli DSM 19437 TaxID=929713 RepID=W0F677_9BACT|nr:glycoside hydrolase family 88 protein [Niabella soli]AHF16959.1 glucuronyl hydrolase [Niabella soli DSM 19437]
MKLLALALLAALFLGSCKTASVKTDSTLRYCLRQASKTLAAAEATVSIPRSIAPGSRKWYCVNYRDWTSGFWPGILWYAYEFNKQPKWKTAAECYSRLLFPLVDSSAIDHDIGFQLYCSAGNGYRLTGDSLYRNILLRAADSLATLYNAKVGTILSWPREVPGVDWPLRHNTIMDNMINLELLFWASKHGGGKRLYDMAVSHATVTMRNQFRPDYTSYHVVVYDTATGKKIRGITHQGFSDGSMWARGQAWAIYGYTMVYRETKDQRFLDFAQKVTDVYLEKLPKDLIPYWDFDDPAIPAAPRDASAAAVTASALLELSTFVTDRARSKMYFDKAVAMLTALSSEKYQSRNTNDAFLLHSTGHKPNGGEIDASIIYADYYYIEALLRLKKLKEQRSFYEKL